MNFRSAIFLFIVFTIVAIAWHLSEIGTARKRGLKSTVIKFTRILCFGDSLTRGMSMTANGERFHYPYSNALEKYLNQTALKQSVARKFIVHTRGIDGEEVRNSMENRLPILLKKIHYDWVIILGGSNDLRVLHENNQQDITYPKSSYQPIFDALIKLHKGVHKFGGKTVAITIPGRRCELKPECRKIKAVRLWLNDRIRKFAAKFKDKVVLADLDKEMNIYEFLQNYWVDEVHYNVDGYDRMGQIIFNAMSSSL